MAVSGLSAAIQRAVAPVARRVRLVVGRGIVKLVNDATKAQTLQVALLAGELRSDVERWEQFGLVSRPPVGSEALFLSVAGDRSHGAVVCVQDRATRPKGVLAENDVALYDGVNGIRVHLVAADGTVGLAGAADYVALAQATDQALSDLQGWVAAIVSAIQAGVPGSTDGGAALLASILAGLPTTTAPASVAATKVKAE